MLSRYAILFLLCTRIMAHGQTSSLKFRTLSVGQGLSNNQVNCVYKDHKGFMWIGTASGLNRFNGYDITVFHHDANQATSLPDDFILQLFNAPDDRIGVLTAAGVSLYDPTTETFENRADKIAEAFHIPTGNIETVVTDPNGHYWILLSGQGLVHYNPTAQTTHPLRHIPQDSTSLASDSIMALTQDPAGHHWIIHANGIVEQLNLSTRGYRVVARYKQLYHKNKGTHYNYRITADQDGDLWIHALNDAQGVYWFSPAQKTFRQFTREAGTLRLNTNIICDIVQDNDGRLWIGTDHGGINLINKKNFTIQYIRHDDEDTQSLVQNSIISLYKDREGIIWIGTFKQGLSYYHKNIIRFPAVKYHPRHTNGLPFGDLNRFVEDRHGNLWIGTNGGGLIYYNRHTGTFTQYKNDPADPHSLSSDVIVSLCLDHTNMLWIGTFYGGLDAYDGHRFTHYTHTPGVPESLADHSVWEVFEDAQHRLWVGTIGGGLDLFDRRTQTFTHFRSGDVNSVKVDYISALTEDPAGNLWIGTAQGVDVLMRKTGRFVHYEHAPNNPRSLSHNNVYDILADSQGRIWIGTQGGLNLFDPTSQTFRIWQTPDGLPHHAVLTILEGDHHDLWMSTPRGLVNMIQRTPHTAPQIGAWIFNNYDEADGLQGKQFNENAALKTSRGELIFGGPNGFNLFKPTQIGAVKNPPAVVLSDFQLFNKSLQPGKAVDGEVILHTAITEAHQVTLPPGRNMFSIEFAALNFFHPEKTQYHYQLEGFDDHWLLADNQTRKVTYTNLDPGTYTFTVNAANAAGRWADTGTTLTVTILPPFWKTRTAFFVYFLIILGGLLAARKLIQQREQMKYALEAERREAIRMHELDVMKIRFFTNVSHEFRTPLSLILSPLDKIIARTQDEGIKKQLLLVQRNARRLLNLVNRLLDFRKLEVQEIQLIPTEGDVITFIRETVYSFSDLSEKKDIALTLTSALPTLQMMFDQDKLEKILFNLLSNAFKFTPEHGQVTVDMATEDTAPHPWLRITVQDTGIGIPANKLDKIFERFFQHDVPTSMVNQGSGIGLAITREFTRLHGGTIQATSTPGQGSCFTVRLPIQTVLPDTATPTQYMLSVDEVNTRVLENLPAKNKKPVLLLVEDNEDFRFYLKDNLQLEYTVLEARHGKEGLAQAEKHKPDLVVSDIMMPEMDGVALCQHIRTSPSIAHTPVILLTARTSNEQQLQGYDVGANDYITKPFNFELLAARIKNLLALPRPSREEPQHLPVKASQLQITPLDEQFIQNAIKYVEAELSSPEFSVEVLSQHLGMSRANLYKKILALTGKSPLEFIRTIRMQQAAQLLEKSQLTVAEVAYQVGFNNPKYFSRYFKEAFNMLPSAYAARNKNSEKANRH